MNTSGIEAILFDLHGVLCDGDGWHEEAFVEAMREWGYEVTPGLFRKGFTTSMRLVELGKIGKAPLDHDYVIKRKTDYILEIIKEKCRPLERVTDAVKFANSYTNGRVAVVTNSSKESTHRILERTGLQQFFSVVITNEDVGNKIKPHPLPYFQASYGLGVSSHKCLAIDDSSIGIESAVDARCKVLKITSFENLTVDLLKNQLKLLEIRI